MTFLHGLKIKRIYLHCHTEIPLGCNINISIKMEMKWKFLQHTANRDCISVSFSD